MNVASDLEKAKRAGEQYAGDQLTSNFFQDWVFDQLREAREMEKKDPGSIAAGFETRTIARSINASKRLARRMLEQLRWDISRDIGGSEVEPYLDKAGVEGRIGRDLRDAFSGGVRTTLSSDETATWLAEEYIMPIAQRLR